MTDPPAGISCQSPGPDVFWALAVVILSAVVCPLLQLLGICSFPAARGLTDSESPAVILGFGPASLPDLFPVHPSLGQGPWAGP